jgi:hypothetical protein
MHILKSPPPSAGPSWDEPRLNYVRRPLMREAARLADVTAPRHCLTPGLEALPASDAELEPSCSQVLDEMAHQARQEQKVARGNGEDMRRRTAEDRLDVLGADGSAWRQRLVVGVIKDLREQRAEAWRESVRAEAIRRFDAEEAARRAAGDELTRAAAATRTA